MMPLRHIILDAFIEELPKEDINKVFPQVPMDIPSWVLELYQAHEFKTEMNKLYELAEVKSSLFEIANSIEYSPKTVKLLHSHSQLRHHKNDYISTEIHRIFIDKIVKNYGNLTVLLCEPTVTLVTDLRLSKIELTTSTNFDYKNSIVIAKRCFREKLEVREMNNVTYVDYPTIGLTELFNHLKTLLDDEELKWLG